MFFYVFKPENSSILIGHVIFTSSSSPFSVRTIFKSLTSFNEVICLKVDGSLLSNKACINDSLLYRKPSLSPTTGFFKSSFVKTQYFALVYLIDLFY